MTLEVLFARQLQTVTFLRLAVCGLACGALVQACGALSGRWRLLTPLWEALAAISAAGLILPVLIASGEGVRAYGLLGLCVGGALYAAGVRPIVSFIGKRVHHDKNNSAQKQEDDA